MPRSPLTAAVLALALAACAGPVAVEATTDPTPASTTSSTTAPAATDPTTAPTTDPGTPAYDHLVATFEYGSDLVGEVHALPGTGERPVVVTVHGGGWYGGSRLSLGALADALAGRDVVAVNVSYRTGSAGGGTRPRSTTSPAPSATPPVPPPPTRPPPAGSSSSATRPAPTWGRWPR